MFFCVQPNIICDLCLTLILLVYTESINLKLTSVFNVWRRREYIWAPKSLTTIKYSEKAGGLKFYQIKKIKNLRLAWMISAIQAVQNMLFNSYLPKLLKNLGYELLENTPRGKNKMKNRKISF